MICPMAVTHVIWKSAFQQSQVVANVVKLHFPRSPASHSLGEKKSSFDIAMGYPDVVPMAPPSGYCYNSASMSPSCGPMRCQDSTD